VRDFRTERVPYPIACHRKVISPLPAIQVNPGNPASVCDLTAGLQVELCDLEDTAVLLLCQFGNWYKTSLEDIVEKTRPLSGRRGLV
jgi:hypothetical protein